MDVVMGLFVNLAKVRAWSLAVGVARKHVVNWPEPVIGARLGKKGVFRSRAGGTISCEAKMLLRLLVRLEDAWQRWGDVLNPVRFENDSLIISGYFGRDFRFPLRTVFVSPPSLLLKYYPFDVMGETVLDIGAFLGDTPLMWLNRGARSVIAVEPVPLHFQYLEMNTAGLPVTCLNVSLAVQLPKIPVQEARGSYGLSAEGVGDMLDVPVVQLTELVERYGPTVVKLNCEGCEHYVLEQLSQIPQLGVKKIAVQFHDIRGYDAYASLAFLRDKLGEYYKTMEHMGTSISGRAVRLVTVYWLL